MCTARPIRIDLVRPAKLLAIVMGAESTRPGLKWYSASHTDLTPSRSASSTISRPS